MDWRVVDERLIRRGEFLLSLDFLESYGAELMALNRLIRRLPSADYSWIRRCILTLNLSSYDSLRGSANQPSYLLTQAGLASTSPGLPVFLVFYFNSC